MIRRKQAGATVIVGDDDWPFPVPLVKKTGKWFFDSDGGSQEIFYRRIGANELDAIQVCRGLCRGQHQYALTIHDDSGINQYAQKIISTPGKQDGLYWQNADGTSGGPISEAVAKAIEEGYSVEGNPHTTATISKSSRGRDRRRPLGNLDYVIQGAMIGGFALVAVPAQYRVTGRQDIYGQATTESSTRRILDRILSRWQKGSNCLIPIAPGTQRTISGRQTSMPTAARQLRQ